MKKIQITVEDHSFIRLILNNIPIQKFSHEDENGRLHLNDNIHDADMNEGAAGFIRAMKGMVDLYNLKVE
jgi:hypothetical protein